MIINKNKMNKRIALFTNGNKNYFFKAKRCFEVFEELNPNVFDFYYITSDTEAVPLKNMNVIIFPIADLIQSWYIIIPSQGNKNIICWGEIWVIMGKEIGSITTIETIKGLKALKSNGVFNIPLFFIINIKPYTIPTPEII